VQASKFFLTANCQLPTANCQASKTKAISPCQIKVSMTENSVEGIIHNAYGNERYTNKKIMSMFFSDFMKKHF
jgi:hypothetical protein